MAKDGLALVAQERQDKDDRAATRSAISGTTLLTGTVADPITHVRAPEAMGAWFASRGIDAVWLPFHVHPKDLSAFVAGMRRLQNLAGFTVTMPHKEAIIPLLDEVSERVRRSGSTNMIRREPDGHLVGDNADGIGFIEGLRSSGIDVAGRTVWVVGAGGAGRAIAWALAEEIPAGMAIFDIDPERQDRLVHDIGRAFPTIAVTGAHPTPQTVDIAINATPLGLRDDDALPFDPATLRPDTRIVEIIMKPTVTSLMREALSRGMTVVPGQRMLDSQLPIYAEFLGLAPGIACPDPGRPATRHHN